MKKLNENITLNEKFVEMNEEEMLDINGGSSPIIDSMYIILNFVKKIFD